MANITKKLTLRTVLTILILFLIPFLGFKLITQGRSDVLGATIQCTPPPPPECECEKGMVELTVRYNGPQTGVTVDVYSKDYPEDHIGHFDNVQKDQLLTVYGPNGERMNNTTKYYINGTYNAQFHTSCSEYILNQTHGKFTVIGWKDGKGHVCNPQYPPEPYPDSAELCAGDSVTIDVLANDTDPDGNINPSSVYISVAPTHGTIDSIDPSNGNIRYTASHDFAGIDVFTYGVCDTQGLCATATVTITINYCPSCPNGVLDPGEECDDGNYNDGDGCSSNCTIEYICETGDLVYINFDQYPRGTIINNQYVSDGVVFYGDNNNGPDATIIFDTANPSGNDPDLVTPGYGYNNTVARNEVLIIPQDAVDANHDGLIDNPNDDADGGKMEILFSTPAEILNLGLLDIDESGGAVRLYTVGGTPINTYPASNLGDNSFQRINVNQTGVGKLEVELVGSGALTDISYCIYLPECGNGIVDDGEECDDGNDINGDGCSNECTIEQVDGQCYLIADSGGHNGGDDLLTKVDPADFNPLTNEINIGTGTGTHNMEAIAFDPDSGTLYGANANQLGTLDLNAGVFSSTSSTFGTASGADGDENINDVDGLTFDSTNGTLYGSERRGGSDLLIQIDPSTGAHIPNAFGSGVDYVVVDPISGLNDVDDIAIDPVNGQMYATVNNDQRYDRLVLVNKNNGDTTDIGPLGVDNIEGLGFDTNGNLYGTNGGSSRKLYEIDKTTGTASNPRVIDNASDYEGFDCYIELHEPTCGNGIVEEGEECDDGNDNNDDSCRNDCTLPFCGDGDLDEGEECDDGNDNNNDSCRNDCTTPYCGDGILDPGEECDDGNNMSGDGCSSQCTREQTTIISHKIVCDYEDDLPNWGYGGPDITSETAQQFVNEHENCSFAEGWVFQWGDSTVTNPGDMVGEVGPSTGWNSFGPTDENGMASVTIENFHETSKIKVREAFKAGYIPFTYSNDNSDESAEFYCHNDVEYYDNYDFIENPEYDGDEGCSQEAIDALKDAGKDKGNVNLWCFEFADGWSGCGTSLENNANIHDMTVHVSCSADYDENGYPNKEQPDPDQGDPAVVKYSIKKWSIDFGKDKCDKVHECGMGSNGGDGGTYYCVGFNVHEPSCGDGILHPGEECDDGNQNNDDECRNDCTIPECGDGILDPEEDCDDGNQNNNDSCRNDCTIPECGDGILDPGEECDDGNQSNDDDCRNDCTIPECGDGILDPGEDCDDGNQNNYDECRNDCTSSYCGDGIVDDDEECDDGNQNNNDDCRNDCTFSYCGDGIVDDDEECDDGNQNNDDDCRNDCTSPYCGDGIVDPDEECDDGNLNNYDDCRNDCTTPYCGDGTVDPGEECDDGNQNNDDDCRNDCTSPYCGDGKVDPGEECDDGNQNNDDDCRNDCTSPYCGDGVLDPGEECDDGNTNDNDGCSSNCDKEKVKIIAHKIVCDLEADLPNWGESAGPYITASTAQQYVNDNQNCHFAEDWSFQWAYNTSSNPGDNTGEADPSTGWTSFGPTDTSGQTSTEIEDLENTPRLKLREVFKVGEGYVEFASANDSTDVSAEFYCDTDTFHYDNYDYIENPQYGSTYYCIGFNALEPYCGDGYVDEDEECDDGNDDNEDGCRNDCTTPYCPDGIVDNGEECDDGNMNNFDECRNDCTNPYCGDGIIDPDEECDDGNTNNNDDCRNDCKRPACGDGILDPGEECDDGNTNNSDDCRNDCTVPSCGDGVVDFGEECDDGNENNDDDCRNDCTLPYCGDGVLDPGEACDDGNTDNNDSCRNDCSIPSCGDSILDLGEECDPPGDSDICESGTCDESCTCTPPPTCGDGSIDPGEECDPPGNAIQCTYGICDTNCTCPAPPLCGNGLIEAGEQCDPPGASGLCESGLCSGTCTCTPPPSCGNGILEFGEQCDPPGLSGQCASGLCLGNCTCTTPPTCGDGNLDPLEECDPPGSTDICVYGPCGTNCICPSPPPIPAAPSRVSTGISEGCGLIFGANEFILSSHASPISSHGIIQFTRNDPQRFYLEAKNANEAKVVNIDTLDEYLLEYNTDLNLWTGELIFPEIGTFRLKAVISNEKCSYEREINTVYVFDKSQITDIETGKIITEAQITIYAKDPQSQNFEVWNGSSYGQVNPFSPYGGKFSLILPRGEYYLEVDVPGYNTVRSLITETQGFSVINADIKLKPTGSLAERVISLFTRDYGSNNFPLTVTPMVGMYLLKLDEPVPDITLYDSDRQQNNLYSMLSKERPAVIFVYSSWNTLANEQLEIYQSIRDGLKENYDFIPLTTMEPDNVNKIFLERGAYDIEFFKPDDKFFDDYYIISLPQFFLLDKDGNLKGIITGPQPREELIRKINLVFED
ncbi:DUF4215 domain-containing protein [Candidatus Dojkabacteria bacterium]|nr:DUF4215 domain-containing protein [Candidatus Dojkabacteria bacterium]